MLAVKSPPIETHRFYNLDETLSLLFPQPVDERAFIEALEWLEIEPGVWSYLPRFSHTEEDCSLFEAFQKCKDWPREELKSINASLWCSYNGNAGEKIEALFRQAVQYRWLVANPDKRDIDMREWRVWADGNVPSPDAWPTVPQSVYAAFRRKP